MATSKKPVTKKTAVKKTAAKKASTKQPEMKSFKVSPQTGPFLTSRITIQTVYWSILLIFIMIMQLWILNIQLDIIEITDSIMIEQL